MHEDVAVFLRRKIHQKMTTQTMSMMMTRMINITSINSTTNNTTNTDNYQNQYNYMYYDSDGCDSLHCIYEVRYRIVNRTNLLSLAVILSILGIVGIMGNLLVLIVLLRSKVKQTSIYLMSMLSVVDLIACAIVIPGLIAREWHCKFYYNFLCKLWEMLRYFTIPTSAMILVAIAFDRFYIICFSPRRISQRATAVIIAIIFLLGVGCGVPPVLGLGVYANYGSGEEIYVGYCISNYLDITIAELDIYWYVITAIFLFMILSIILLYLSIFYVVLKQNRKWNKIKSVQPMTTEQGDRDVALRRQSEPVHRFSRDDGLYNTRASVDLIRRPTSPSLTLTEITEIHPQDHHIGQTYEGMSCQEKTKLSARKMADLENDLDQSPTHDLTSFTDLESCSKVRQLNVGLRKSKESKVSPMVNARAEEQNVSISVISKSAVKKECKIQVHKQSQTVKHVTIKDSKVQKSSYPVNPKSGSRKIHIKTTQVLFTVTLVYIISFLPTFLMSHNLIPQQKVVYFMYFINNTANPLIYSFMNPKFRQEMYKLIRSCRLCKP